MDFWTQFWPQFWASLASAGVIALVTLLVTYFSRSRIMRWFIRSSDEARKHIQGVPPDKPL